MGQYKNSATQLLQNNSQSLHKGPQLHFAWSRRKGNSFFREKRSLLSRFWEQYSSKQTRIGMLFVQLLLLFVPSIQFFSIRTDNGPIPASLCYFFSLAFVPYLLIKIKELRLPPWYITGLYGWVVFVTVLRISQYGLSKSILHWTFGIYLLVVLLNVGNDFTQSEWMRLLEKAFCTFACMVFLYTVFANGRVVCRNLVGYFQGTMTGGAGCYMTSLTRGGRNLDATWQSLGGFFVHGKKKAVYVTWAILFAFLGGSRVGVVSAALMVLWSLIYDEEYRLRLKNLKWYILYAVVMLAVLFGSGMGQAFLNRTFLHIPAPQAVINTICDPATDPSEDPSEETAAPSTSLTIDVSEINESSVTYFLSGRSAMWTLFPEVFRANPWGYGVGNAMRVMKSSYGFTSFEDIMHNVFLQWSLDEGIVGGLWYIGLVLVLFVSQWKCRPRFFEDPFAAYFLTYIVLSLVQFHGAEALMIYVLGIYLIQLRAHCICFDKLFSKTRKG